MPSTAALASASIGQVHAARLKDGTSVVVKVQHPHIVERIRNGDRTVAQLVAALYRGLDPRLLGFACVLVVVTGILFSIIPAVQTARGSLSPSLQQGGRAGIGGRAFTRDALVVGQIAVALMLLAVAG